MDFKHRLYNNMNSMLDMSHNLRRLTEREIIDELYRRFFKGKNPVLASLDTNLFYERISFNGEDYSLGYVSSKTVQMNKIEDAIRDFVNYNMLGRLYVLDRIGEISLFDIANFWNVIADLNFLNEIVKSANVLNQDEIDYVCDGLENIIFKDSRTSFDRYFMFETFHHSITIDKTQGVAFVEPKSEYDDSAFAQRIDIPSLYRDFNFVKELRPESEPEPESRGMGVGRMRSRTTSNPFKRVEDKPIPKKEVSSPSVDDIFEEENQEVEESHTSRNDAISTSSTIDKIFDEPVEEEPTEFETMTSSEDVEDSEERIDTFEDLAITISTVAEDKEKKSKK